MGNVEGASELQQLCHWPDVCVLATYRDLSITVWHGSGDEQVVQRLDHALASWMEAHPSGVSGVHVVRPEAGLPTASAREALAVSGRRWAKQTAAVAVVIERAGFFGSAMRSAVTGIQMLAKVEFPIRIVGSLREAAEWLPEIHRTRTGTSHEPADLLGALSAARELRPAAA